MMPEATRVWQGAEMREYVADSEGTGSGCQSSADASLTVR